LPPVGSALAHAFLSPLALLPGEDAGLLPALLELSLAGASQRGIDFLTLGFAGQDTAMASIRRRFRTLVFESRLYSVAWPDGGPAAPLDDRPVAPEVAL
jgi:hypothetical protein